MNLHPAMTARLVFLARVTDRECTHLSDTDRRLFESSLSNEQIEKIANDPILAERLDAFVTRFGRLQDTVGDKLLPAVLTALGEKVGAAIDNLDRAEKFGLIESVDDWMVMRKLRNQMVHEYIEDLTILSGALRSGHEFVPALIAAAGRCVAEVNRILLRASPA